jgi:hypothetical protein
MADKTDDVFDPNAAKAESKPEKKPADKPAGKPADKKDKAPAAPAAAAALKIDTDVPMPENTAGRKSSFNPERMPFGSLEVGQSFADALTDGKTADGITIKTVMAQVKKLWPDRTFIVRETGEGKSTTARFWRKK